MKKDGKQMDCFQDDDKLELPIDNTVYNVKQDNVSVDDFKQVHFGITITHKEQSKRTTVMLESYLVKALRRKHGLSGNTAIRLWLEQAIKNDGRFDSTQPLTRQLKRLVIE